MTHAPLDVLHYQLSLQANLEKKAIIGYICISLRNTSESHRVLINSGNLNIKQVYGSTVESYQHKGEKLILSLTESSEEEHFIQISYTGNPKKGLIFLSDPLSLYTVFFTSAWMPCHEDPGDKASIHMDVIIPEKFSVLASGEFISKNDLGKGLTTYSYRQSYESPAYTYGFVVGDFHVFEEKQAKTSLAYYSSTHYPQQLADIFGETGDILSFFERISGIPYGQSSYAQILIGNHYQEMSGLSVLRESYGKLVLADSTETNLISHELAHQWWGNRITCESWQHFWLNEGFATFLSAAYNEYRFGKEKYLENIDSYFQVYNRIKKKGGDKSLVFKDWINPSRDDRNLVYFKGAYVLHLLKEKLGDEVFWKAIKFYSQSYFGKSVNTRNFQDAIEKSSQIDLQEFFDEWIY